MVLSSTDKDWDVVQARETSDLALSSNSGSLEANKLWRLPLKIFWKKARLKQKPRMTDRKMSRKSPIFLGDHRAYHLGVGRLSLYFLENLTLVQ